METIDAFLAGLKPAIYEKKDPRYDRYPHIILHNDLCLYFQTENMKRQFINNTKNVSFPSLEFERILGLTLGFPPKAVEYYVAIHQEQRKNGDTSGLELGLHYCGVECLTSLHDLTDNVLWLWDQYSHPSILEISVLRENESGKFVEMLEVSYQDRNKLAKIQNELRRKEAIYT